LEDMEIAGCGQLTLLPHMDGLTSLQRLEISDCNSIRSLPSRGLPRSLQVLSINNCHQLSQSCKNLGSTVPSVWINGNRIY
jgi:Leucine-rich repeat (LRR) protein